MPTHTQKMSSQRSCESRSFAISDLHDS